jgi:hypothetical protein
MTATTTTQAALWQQRRDHHVDQGHDRIIAGELAWDDLDAATTVDALIRHAAMCGDGWIAHDFMDCLLPVARPEDRPALVRYRKARMAHPDFKRRDYGANAHHKVIAAWRAAERKVPKQAAAVAADQPAPKRMDRVAVAQWCTCDGYKFERRRLNVERVNVPPIDTPLVRRVRRLPRRPDGQAGRRHHRLESMPTRRGSLQGARCVTGRCWTSRVSAETARCTPLTCGDRGT